METHGSRQATRSETLNIQIFGTKKHKETRAALRFFAERRIKVHFVDFAIKGPSKGELRRFVQKFGIEKLFDAESRRYRDLGLQTVSYSEDRWLEKAIEEPLVLQQPLVRNGNQLTVGPDPSTWKTWVSK